MFECPEEEALTEQIVEKISQEILPNPLECLWQKYQELSQNYTDCKIKVQVKFFLLTKKVTNFLKDSIYNCHKVLLVSSGKFFKNLFLHGFMESLNKDPINLGNIDSKIFEYILCFISFEDEFANLPTNILKEEDWISVLKTAQYLTLYKLQSICEQRLVELLTPENVFFLLDLSILYHSEILEKGCLSYIASK